MNLRGYHGLTVWNRSVDLVEMVFHLSNRLRDSSCAEVIGELRRAALALPTNLAAGYQSRADHQYLRHVHACQIHLVTIETQLAVLERMEWSDSEELQPLKNLLTHLYQLLGCLERYLLTGDNLSPAEKVTNP